MSKMPNQDKLVSNQSAVNNNSSMLDHVVSNDDGKAANSRSFNNRKSRRRKSKCATNGTKPKTTPNTFDGKKDFPKLGEYSSYRRSFATPSNSAPHIQNQIRGGENHLTLRPRSHYPTHNYRPIPDNNFHRFNELSKYLEPPSFEQWPEVNAGSSHLNTGLIWRQRNAKLRDINSYYPAEEETLYLEKWHGQNLKAIAIGAVITPNGTISLRLHNRIRVDLTVDRAIRIINFKSNIVLAINGSGSASALLHPYGRVYQYQSRVEILAHNPRGNKFNNKYAKMWYKGVSFTSDQCALVYLVDAAGTRTTTDTFSDMDQDFSLNVFYAESRRGPACIPEAAATLNSAQYWITDEGVENWVINNIRVSQAPDGLVRIGRNSNKYQMRTSPAHGTASITTPCVHCTASLGQTSHLFVRRGERRLHYDGSSFIVRNAGHSAGFDENNQLKVY